MPLPGGPSAKAGDRYELLWTVHCMLRVLAGEVESIRLEPPGEEGEGIEFTIDGPSGTEYHQAKRQHTGRGVWSLAELAKEGVLARFHQKLDAPSAGTVFVSAHAAHSLGELADRARAAVSWEEFERVFVSSIDWSGHFDNLNRRWGSPDKSDSYERLKRVYVRTIDEESLRGLVHSRMGALADGDPATATDVLAQFALDQTHQRLRAEDVWGHLRDRGFHQQNWSQDATVIQTIADLKKMYMAGIRPWGIRGKDVPREETARILEHFRGDDGRTITLVTGKAGVGKTSVIAQVLGGAEIVDWPLLAFRVDRLEPVHRPEEVGDQLGLPASPVRTLAAVAGGRECLLVIDQLDAVSLASGRHPEFFDCIASMLEEACHHPNMKVFGACRKFDVDNDPRLRHLIGENGIAREFPVAPFDHETVRRLSAKLGIDPAKLRSKQLDLLALPVHMRLLSEVVADDGIDASGLQTTKDLYDRFWDYKLQVMQSSSIASGKVRRVVDMMVDHMNEREVLFVPKSLLDDHFEVATVMLSENILVSDGTRVSFFHESFFDYAFARRMESSGDGLATYIRARGQSLFVRSQARQVLLHRRDLAPQDALRDMDAILNGDDIRIHLKIVVLALLGGLDDPTKEEWGLLEPMLETPLSDYAGRSIYGSVSWFDLLDSDGIMGGWLNGDNEALINRAIWLLHGVLRNRSDRAAELLAPFLSCSEAWNQRLVSVVLVSDLAESRKLFDLALNLVKSGVMDDALRSDDAVGQPWYSVHTLAGKNPEWACELIAAFCERLMALALADHNSNPFGDMMGRQDSETVAMREAADGAPRTFVELMLPFFLEVLERNTDKGESPPWSDSVWHPEYYANGYGLGDNFLLAMESAMRHQAATDVDEFRKLAEQFRSSNFDLIHFLLARGYQANGEVFADEAVEYVTEALVRFGGRYPSRIEWAIAKLLGAVTPHCSNRHLERLERTVLGHCSDFEKTHEGRRWWGSEQLGLLGSIATARLSGRASVRLGELRRKFIHAPALGPHIATGGMVKPPISDAAARRMSDDHWLGAMERYHSTHRLHDGDFLKGGALELSRLLESLTKEDPARFAELAHRMPDDTNPNYFEAILRGITGSALGMPEVVAVCYRCNQVPDQPFGRWIPPALVQFPGEALPDEALALVAWYATEDPDPGYGSPDYQRDLMTAAINSVRGTAADAMARLIFQNRRYLAFFEPYLKVMVNDPFTSVRAMAAHTLLAALSHDRDLAVDLFIELCDAGDELLSTHYIESFLKYGVQTHFQQLRPVLARMMASDIDDVATAGARQACLASLTVNEALALGQICANGSKLHRLGAAEIYAANLKMSAHRAECETMVATLFDDPDKEVRDAAASCFRRFDGPELRDYPDLIERYAKSAAFGTALNPLITAVEKSTAVIPEITLMVCERFFEIAGRDAGDIRTMASAYARNTVELVLRVYSLAPDHELRRRCLDLVDQMYLLGAFGLDEITAEFDR